MAKIREITAREILNCKAVPTIETTVILSDNAIGIASAPSATSIADHEAREVRDNDPSRYNGMGVRTAVENVEKIIAPALVGKEAYNLADIDKVIIQLDGTPNKEKLGSNTTLSVSAAVAKASAHSAGLPLYIYLRQYVKQNLPLKIPTPIFNLISGGEHSGNNLDFQEFLIIPATSKPFPETLEMSVLMYRSLKSTLAENNFSTLLGDEGGFGPSLSTNFDAFALMRQAVDKANLKFGFDIFFGLDAASNSFYKNNHYTIKDRARSFATKDLIAYYEELNKQYTLLYLEDPLAQEDWEGWIELCARMGTGSMVVGDDLIATNIYRLQTAISKNAISGVIIKPNQVGTVIEALAIAEIVRSAGFRIITSGRSGETNDDFIADFAVAISADYVKFGAPARGERVVKYNKLLQIDQQIRNLQGNH